MKHYKDFEYSHLDKMYFPENNLTKEDIITYYQKIAAFMLPHIKNRPVTLERYPEGVHKKGFYMKQVPDYFPNWIHTTAIDLKEGEMQQQILCNKKKILSYLINQGVITLHTWLSDTSSLTTPNKMIFDLDPNQNNLKVVKSIALTLKDVLEKNGLTPYIMTTGSQGVHIVVPIKPELTFDKVKDVADYFAQLLVEKLPQKTTLEQRKQKRNGKVFIDTLRNAYGQTSVAPYSIRTVKEAAVATPLTWREFKVKSFDPKRYTYHNIFNRLGQIKDPWRNINRSQVSLNKLIDKL
ncbi:MAG: non-homologous end-joining DNA ligase [Candidatus Izemoplasma sp.]|nr:non-homologous end-joining DNA ligase [Candidatus Izemoplasma sp.]